MASSIADLLVEQGRVLAEQRRRSGDRRAAVVVGLGQIPGAILADRAAQAAAQRKAQIEAQELALRGSAEARAIAQLELSQNADARAQGTYEAERMAEPRAREAVLGWMKQHASALKPEEAARMEAVLQMPGGAKHLVEQLSKAPEPFKLIERDPTKDLVNPQTGAVVTAGVAKPEKVTFGAPQPYMLNGRRILARAGSDNKMYDMQGQPIADAIAPDVPPTTWREDPLKTQTEWAIAPGETEARLMTKDEIRRLGAKRPAGADRPSSGQQKRVLNFFNRAQQADADLEAMEANVQEMGLAGQTRMEWAPNVLQSDVGQRYLAAQRAFTEARLRKDSGAAIPKEEFTNDRKTYFPQPGDSQATLAQKRRARAAILASLAFESGQALGEYVGDTEEAKRVIQSYKDRSVATGAPPKNETPEQRAKRLYDEASK